MTEETARRIAVALEQLVVLVNSIRQQVFLVADEVVGRRMFGRSVREQDDIAALREEEAALGKQEGQRR